MRELLDTVSGLSSYEVAAELTSQVIPAIVDQKNLHLRFKFLEDARQEAEKALPVLERHIDSSVLPLPLAATTSALTADNLLKGLAAAYFDIAKEVTEGNHQKGLTSTCSSAPSIAQCSSLAGARTSPTAATPARRRIPG